MANKKVSYKNLLKQAISEYDTSKTVQVKGPMLDPILSWDGDGEIPIYKDAASILERYYFNENAEDPVMVTDLEEMEYNEDGTEPKTKSQEHGEGPGTQQAGTSKATNIKGDLKAQEEDIAKEGFDLEAEGEFVDEDTLRDDLELFFSEQDEEGGEEKKELDVDKKMGEKEGEEAAKKGEEEEEEEEEEGEEMEESAAMTEEAENAVIEKLIDEMEELDEAPMSYSGEGPKVSGKSPMSYEKEGPAPGMEAPDEKESSGPEQDTKGAGTNQAGTGDSEGQIPPRKDMHDQMVKPKNYSESDLFDLDDDELLEALAAELSEEDLSEKEWDGKDVPKKKEYHDEQSAVPGGPSPKKAGSEGEDWDEGKYYEESDSSLNEEFMRESFEIFKEAIEGDEEDLTEDDDDIIV
jgi:hypothetical protein